MLSSLPVVFLLSVALRALAAPQPSPTPLGQSIPLTRRPKVARSIDDWSEWAKNQREAVRAKYTIDAPSTGQLQKRGSGTNLITNQNADSSYYGSLAIGTPPVSYDVILDTGSADLWLADADCSSCGQVPTFNPASSSTFKNTSEPFSIQYGSGAAEGVLGSDTVQMAGFSVSNQVFGVCDAVSSGLLTSPVSGLLGLGWQALASSNASPLWQTLAGNGAWDSPLMAFFLTRYQNDTSVQALEPGGSFTMGFTDTSLFSGEIEYIDIPSGEEAYWTLPMTEITVQGSSITLSSGSSSYAAIDTGTTLVGGPSTEIAELYAQIPGSAPGSGNYQGYYTYPCTTTINVTLSFGGRNWAVSNDDFQIGQISNSLCVGAFFDIDTGSNSVSWIVGDTFLKNVYSVFRYSPASVGFATLSEKALAQNGAGGAIPTATIGAVTAAVSASGGQLSNAAVSSSSLAAWSGVGVAAVVSVLAAFLV